MSLHRVQTIKKRSRKNKGPFCRSEFPPLARLETAESETPDPDAEQAQSRMPHGRCHTANLAVLSFDQFETEPAYRNRFAKANGRKTRRNQGLRVENPGTARQGPITTHQHSLLKSPQRRRHWNSLHLDPILPLVSLPRFQEAGI